MFVLSDPSEPEFSEECNHSHDLVCNDCERLYHLESLMKNAFSDPEVVFYSNDEKEDKLHDVHVSLESIYPWKRHLLRAVHQDRARSWMKSIQAKFLSRKILQRNSCHAVSNKRGNGKRGISWHI